MPQFSVGRVLILLEKSVKLYFDQVAEMLKLLLPCPGGVQLASKLYVVYEF